MKSSSKSRYRLLQVYNVQAVTKIDKMQATAKRELKEISLCVDKILIKKERREGDSNPRDAEHHGISNPAPYRAWLSRHKGLQEARPLKRILCI